MTWRLWLALFAFIALAPAALVVLPCAALLALAPDRSVATKGIAAVAGLAGLGLLALTGGDPLGAATQVYILLVTVAFAAGAALRPETPVLRQAMRAALAAAGGTALLVFAVWGIGGWDALAWHATRDAGRAAGFWSRLWPDGYNALEPVTRFVSTTVPAALVLQSIAGLALAWQIHARLAHPALGAPLARFREFRMGDGWVWGVVAWLGLFIAPVAAALKAVGTNIAVVAGTLYLLRGAAIVVAFAEAAGVAAVMLVIAAGVATVLALPLLFLLPGLATLGLTDTWYDYRRRLAASRPNAT